MFVLLFLFVQFAWSVSIQHIYTEDVHTALAMGLDEVSPSLRPISFSNVHSQLVLLEIENTMSGGLVKNNDLKPMNCQCKFIPVSAKLDKGSGKALKDAAKEADSNAILKSMKEAKELAEKKAKEAEQKKQDVFKETSDRNDESRDQLEGDMKDREAAQELQKEKQKELTNEEAFDRDDRKHKNMRTGLQEDVSEDELSFLTLQSQVRLRRGWT